MKQTTLAVSRSASHRSGAALLLVVIAVVISAMVAATLAQAAISQRRQMQREQVRAQSFWLAESGIDRAIAKLERDSQYRGEEWRVEVPVRSEPQSALVTIQVTAVDANSNQRRVDVIAEFPAGNVHRCTLRRQMIVGAK